MALLNKTNSKSLWNEDKECEESFFAFPACFTRSQTLHVGIVNLPEVTLKKYAVDSWKELRKGKLERFKKHPSDQ